MIIIDTNRCVGCGECVKDCLNRVIRLRDGHAEVLRPCFMCGHCIAVCPASAVSADDLDMSEVIDFDKSTCSVPPDVMLNTVKCRRSIRRFRKDRLKREELEAVLEAGRFSPTGSNAQNVSYLVFHEEAEELRRVAMEQFRKYRTPEAFAELFPPPMSPDRVDFDDDDFLFKGADTVILTVCSSQVNAAIASANMELMANSLGIGMLYVGFFVRLAGKDRRVREFLGLKDGEQVVTALCFGYPDVSYYRSVPRKKLQAKWR